MESHGCGEHWRTMENAWDEILRNNKVDPTTKLHFLSKAQTRREVIIGFTMISARGNLSGM